MQQKLTAHYNDPWSTQKKKIMTAWLLTNVSIFPFFISVMVATGLVSAEGHNGTGFSLIWTFFHTIGLFVFGTYTLFKRMTPAYYGMLSASCLFMGSWMLQTCIVVGQYNCVNNGTVATGFGDCLSTSENPGAIRSTIAFGVFLFLGYMATGILLLLFKKDMTKMCNGNDDDTNSSRIFLSEDDQHANPNDFESQGLPSQKYSIEEDDDDEEEVEQSEGGSNTSVPTAATL